MADELLPFYERELSALRALAAEFSERYPKVARRLQINPDHCDDPQVERLLEAFAWFGARIHRRLDDQVPEIAEPLIQALGPPFLRTVPSATILQLQLKPGAGKHTIARHCQVLAPAVQGSRCAYRTCQDLDLWPLAVAQAGLELEAPGGTSAITLDLVQATHPPIPDLDVDRLSLHLDGAPGLVNLLYELLGFRLQGVRVTRAGQEPGAGLLLPASRVTRAGFSDRESLFDPDPGLLPGYRLLFEFFAFPGKFRFLELAGLGQVPPGGLRLRFLLPRQSGAGRAARLLETLSADSFKLGCVPAVNLFSQPAEAIKLSGHQSCYPLALKGRDGSQCEIHGIDSVRLTRPGATAAATVAVPAAHALRFGAWAGEPGFAWQASRGGAENGRDPGADLALALVDGEGKPFRPPAGTLDAQLTCTNRRLPEAIPFGGGDPGREDFLLNGHPVVGRVRALCQPTPGSPAPAKPGLLWRIIAHLAMNHLALAALDRDGLQEMLELYAFTDSNAVARLLRGIHRLETRPVTALVTDAGQPHFARGIEVAVTFDEEGSEDADPYLFAAILERFLAQVCPRNSFLQLRMLSRQREGELIPWPPRSGGTALL